MIRASLPAHVLARPLAIAFWQGVRYSHVARRPSAAVGGP
jgi:hypothetical protein